MENWDQKLSCNGWALLKVNWLFELFIRLQENAWFSYLHAVICCENLVIPEFEAILLSLVANCFKSESGTGWLAQTVAHWRCTGLQKTGTGQC
jgi:hypothetical protein